MCESSDAHASTIGLKRYLWALLTLWTILVGSVLLWTLNREKREMLEAARIQARSAFEKDLVYRRWAAGHSGVYVPVTDQTPPSPYLSHIEERDITTPSGRALTLVNPAYMTRQVHQMGAEQYGLRGHITSLNPIRPANAPDEWETKALQTFEQGATEVSSVEEIDNQSYMRLMRPMITEQVCLKCHAEQGYKAGDIRGGISVSVPMSPMLAITHNHAVTLVLGHSLLWFLGMTGICAGSRRLGQRIRERDEAEEKIRQQKELLQNTFESLTHPFYVINANDYSITMANSASKIYGDLSELSRCYALSHKRSEPCCDAEHPCPLEEVKKTKKPVTVEHTYYDKDHNARNVEVHGYPIFDSEGNVVEMIEYCIDITDRKRAEEDLRKYREHLEELVETRTGELTQANRQLLQEIEARKGLEKEILNVSEQERRKIGEELHDSLGQQLTGVAFMTKVLEQKLAKKSLNEAADVAEIAQLVNQATNQARSLAKGLHPIDLDTGTLMSSLQDLAESTETLFGIHCTFKCDKRIRIDNAEVAVHLYRITQEAITNAIKHGKAKNIQIDLAYDVNKSVLTVRNDGIDFPKEFEARHTGMGLQIMDHRVDIIEGSLDIRKGPKDGTIMTCTFPIKRQ